MSFHALQVPFELIYYAMAWKLGKLVWKTLKEMTFALVAKRLELLVSRENLFVHYPKTLKTTSVHGFKILKEWIQCLCINVVDSLFVETS